MASIKVWTLSETGVFGVLEERAMPIARTVEFQSPGVGSRGIDAYRGSGSISPVPGDRWSRTIDLAPGEYWNMSAPRTVPNYYRMYNDLKRFGDLGTALATIGFGATEFAFQLGWGAWSGSPGSDPSRNLIIPNVTGNEATGWRKFAGGCQPEQKWWSDFNLVACGTPQTFNASHENQTGVSGVYRVFETTPALTVNPTLINVYANVAQYRTQVGASQAPNPYRKAIVAPGVAAFPFAQFPTTTGVMSHPIRPRLRVRPAYAFEALTITLPLTPPVVPPVVGVGTGYHVPPPDGARPRRKFRMGKGGVVGEAYGALTELKDLMDCMKKSINNKSSGLHGKTGKGSGSTRVKYAPKPHGENPYDEFRYIVNNAERMDPLAFVKCFAQKELGDQVIGRANRAAANAVVGTGYWVSPRGPSISGFARHALSQSGSLRMR